MQITPKNSLIFLWKWLGRVGGVLALANLAQDLVTFAPFVRSLIAYYRNILYPIYDFLLNTLDINLSETWKDILTLYIIFSSAAAWWFLQEEKPFSFIGKLIVILSATMWPIFATYYTFLPIIYKKSIESFIIEKSNDPNFAITDVEGIKMLRQVHNNIKSITLEFWAYLISTFFLFLVLLIANYTVIMVF